ncbi:MAG TPA: PPC domain-containing DNA-binding protein [Candidatus Binatia bacterium]|nr:PPC domain-containing DNA-binding protein [Candidatus Binatia bacterium]
MKFRRETGGTLVVSLERGDAMRASIEALAAAENVPSARLTAIGAVEDAELGFYDLGRKEYLRRSFPGILELVSLEGSITVKDGKPFLHAHVAISGPDFAVHGGHLFDAKAGVVVELFIIPLERPLLRVMCDEIGLARWEPDQERP